MSASINNLNQGTPTTASQIPYYDPSVGQDRACSVASILALSTASASSGLVTQYAAPAATGFTVAIAPPQNGESMFLLLTPLAGYAAGTITLPLNTACVDGQELLVHTTQAVTTLTVSGNGATAVNGAPTTLTQFAFFRVRFDKVNNSWYRVG